MKKYLPLAAFVAVMAVAALITVGTLLIGGGGKPGPDKTAAGWTAAMAAHDYAKACSYEAPSYAGKDCAAAYKEQFATINTVRGKDILKGLESQGCAIIKRYAWCYVTGPNLGDTPAQLIMQQSKNGSWHVVGVG